MKRVHEFIILSFIGLLAVNMAFISAYVILEKYGLVTLSSGEKYTMNIPFIGSSNSPMICGKAQKTSGEVLEGINVSVYHSNSSFLNKSTTNSEGEYCITLPEITSNKKYNVSIEFDNKSKDGTTLQLASNDYTLDLDNNKVFNKSTNVYAVLSGDIINQDARVEDGRVEVNLQYWATNSTGRYEIFDYQKYFVNIEPGEVYSIPSSEMNVSWKIPADAELGRYRFYIKPSFNAKEKTPKEIFFNLTA